MKIKLYTFLLTSLISFSLWGQSLSVDFTASQTEICIGESIQFTDNSSGTNIIEYNWNFGNGDTSNDQNPNYTYPSPGTYTITLTVQTSSGQADAEVKTGYIKVHDLPNPNFSISGNSCTVPIDLEFTNTSDVISGADFSWNFGNGTTSSSAHPGPVNYAAPGDYTVTIETTDNSTGCSNSHSETINISDYQADFSFPNPICAGSSVEFSDNSSAGTNKWSWNADGAGSSSQQNPSFTFPSEGTYQVTLTAKNSSSGCTDEITKTVQVVSAVTPSFSVSQNEGCSPFVVNFQNTTGQGGTYTWYFGDGETYQGQNPPSHVYNDEGDYTVSLVFEDQNGCMDSITKVDEITVSEIEADFNAIPLNGCEPLEVNFSDNSMTPNPADNPIINWQWNFGNGQTGTSANPPTVTFYEGKYDVTLIITSANGCKDTIVKEEYIEVGTPQHAEFTFEPDTACVKEDITFTNQSYFDSYIDSSEISWFWNFGEGTSTEMEPTYQYYSDSGYFDIELIIDYRGCKDTMRIDSAVYIHPPVSKFELGNDLFCNPNSFPVNVNTVDTESILGKDNHEIDVYWKWGDNQSTHMPNSEVHGPNKSATSHDYNDYGQYTVWQIIENHTTECVDSSSQTLVISEIVASLDLGIDSLCKGGEVIISGDEVSSTEPVSSWTYLVDNNGTTVTGNPASHVYEESGEYTITQIVANNVGCTSTATYGPITVLEPPAASFEMQPNVGCINTVFTAENNSHPQGNGVDVGTFNWTNLENDEEQTTTDLSDEPEFTYSTPGTHKVSLVVTDDFGCVSSEVIQNIEVTKPTAAFNLDTVVCNQTEYEVINGSSGTGDLEYEWYVDNALEGTDKNIVIQFDEDTDDLSSTHTITLIVFDENGCSDTLTQNVHVSMPSANFSFEASGASLGEDGSFKCPPIFINYEDESQSIGEIVDWEWDFFDSGNTSTNQDPSNTFVFAGTYSTGLIITDEFGCTDTILREDIIKINGPTADPSASLLTDTCGQFVYFDLGETTDVEFVEWDMGNGEYIDGEDQFIYSYSEAGEYHPVVTIEDESGCIVEYFLDPIVLENNGIHADFSYSPSTVNPGDDVTISDESSVSNAPIISWEWTVNDTTYTNGNGDDIVVQFDKPGYYYVELTVTDAEGCTDTYLDSIFVNPDLKIPNVFTPNGDGVNDYLTLNDDYYDEYNIIILNRWGNVVYENPHQEGIVLWDGYLKSGKLCHDGVYYYKFIGILEDKVTIVKDHGFFHVFGTKQ